MPSQDLINTVDDLLTKIKKYHPIFIALIDADLCQVQYKHEDERFITKFKYFDHPWIQFELTMIDADQQTHLIFEIRDNQVYIGLVFRNQQIKDNCDDFVQIKNYDPEPLYDFFTSNAEYLFRTFEILSVIKYELKEIISFIIRKYELYNPMLPNYLKSGNHESF